MFFPARPRHAAQATRKLFSFIIPTFNAGAARQYVFTNVLITRVEL